MPQKKTKRCPKGSRRNASSGECIPTKSRRPTTNTKSNTSKCDTVKCPATKICNPATGKCVLKTGAIGRSLLQTTDSKTTKTSDKCVRRCPKNKILNPATGKCVLRTGAIGLKLIEVQKNVEQQLRELERTADVPESIKKHVRELGSDDPKVREKAMRILQKAGARSVQVLKFMNDYKYIITIGITTLAIYFGYDAAMITFATRAGETTTSMFTSFFGAPFLAAGTGCSHFFHKMWRGVQSFKDLTVARDYQQYIAELKSLKGATDGKQIVEIITKVRKGFKQDPTVCQVGSQAASLLQRFIDTVRVKIANKEDADYWTSYLRQVIIKCPLKNP